MAILSRGSPSVPTASDSPSPAGTRRRLWPSGSSTARRAGRSRWQDLGLGRRRRHPAATAPGGGVGEPAPGAGWQLLGKLPAAGPVPGPVTWQLAKCLDGETEAERYPAIGQEITHAAPASPTRSTSRVSWSATSPLTIDRDGLGAATRHDGHGGRRSPPRREEHPTESGAGGPFATIRTPREAGMTIPRVAPVEPDGGPPPPGNSVKGRVPAPAPGLPDACCLDRDCAILRRERRRRPADGIRPLWPEQDARITAPSPGCSRSRP
jgi:hypothetical protein